MKLAPLAFAASMLLTSAVGNAATSVPPPAAATFVCVADGQAGLAMADRNNPAAGIWVIDYTENTPWLDASVYKGAVSTDRSRFPVEVTENGSSSAFFVSLDRVAGTRHALLYSLSRASDLGVTEAITAFLSRQSAEQFDQIADLSCN